MRMTVSFSANERLLEAALFLPDMDSQDAMPALIFEGSMTAATTQLTEYAANQISRQGYVCLVLDHRFYGEDEQAPQSWESPKKRIEDIKAGFEFLAKQELVNKEKIIGVGVSVGAEYLAQAIRETNVCRGLVMIEGPHDDAQNAIGEVDIPYVVVDEAHLDEAIEQTVMWIRTMWDTNRTWRRDNSIDWSI